MEKKKVVVAGGGVLGAQIALLSAFHGWETVIWLRSEGSIERTEPKLEQFRQAMKESLAEAQQMLGNPFGKFTYPRGLILNYDEVTAEEIDELIARVDKIVPEITLELDMAKALANADIVIESVSENPAVKKEFYQKAAELMPEKTILCTNSSTFLPSSFAEYTGRPEKYLALHFANSIWRNNTAEVMGHPGTDQQYYDEIVKFAKEIGMIPLTLKKEQPGYILNSLLIPFLNAAEMLWANDVASPETIDLTWQLGTGAPAGPFKILDIVGLKTAYEINQMKPGAQDPESITYKIGQLLKEKIDKGELGLSSGKGFYDYSK